MTNKAQSKDIYLEHRISVARRAGACKGYTQEEFKNYLLDLGLNKYMRAILPLETGEEYTPKTEAKIIPFPSVTLHNQPGDLQDEIDSFLREMGYIE